MYIKKLDNKLNAVLFIFNASENCNEIYNLYKLKMGGIYKRRQRKA